MDIPRPENFNEVYLYEGGWLILKVRNVFTVTGTDGY